MPALEKVNGIIKTTQKNPMLGFLQAALIVVVVMAGVIGKQYLESKEVSEDRLRALQICVDKNERLQQEKQTILQTRIDQLEARERQYDSLIVETKKVLRNVKN